MFLNCFKRKGSTKMGTPTIGDILNRTAEDTVDTIPVIIRALKVAGVITPINGDEKAKDLLAKIRDIEPEVLELTVSEILKDTNQQKGSGYKTTTWIMTFCLAIMALTAMGMNVYIAFKTNHILGWDEIILPFIGPLLVVWHERGITLKENRDVLKAMLGKAPSSTIMESVASRIKYSNGNAVQRIEEETVNIRLPKKEDE